MESSEIINQIKTIYTDYCIPLNLQRHMFLVAAVAEQLCDNSKDEVDKDNIVAASLTHDLGNIVKMDFEHENTLCLLDDEDKPKAEFYKKKKTEFVKKYGCNDLVANEKIVEELQVNERITYLFKNKGLEHLTHQEWKKDLGLMIFAYADLRVAPYGVTSLKERVHDFAKRYCKPGDKKCLEDSKRFGVFAKGLEDAIFRQMRITPRRINMASARAYVENYQKNY
ncbi:MAG: HD domain-containing protein [archaeon]|jgi:hypothetical protein